MTEWRSLKEFPEEIQENTVRELEKYNRQNLKTYIIVGVAAIVLTTVLLNIGKPAILLNILIDFVYIILLSLLYSLQKKNTDISGISACEDTVSVYRPARGHGQYYRPPCVITDGGIKAYILSGKKYSRDDKVYIIRCGKSYDDTICMTFDEQEQN